jgi:hypothetical protein
MGWLYPNEPTDDPLAYLKAKYNYDCDTHTLQTLAKSLRRPCVAFLGAPSPPSAPCSARRRRDGHSRLRGGKALLVPAPSDGAVTKRECNRDPSVRRPLPFRPPPPSGGGGHWPRERPERLDA